MDKVIRTMQEKSEEGRRTSLRELHQKLRRKYLNAHKKVKGEPFVLLHCNCLRLKQGAPFHVTACWIDASVEDMPSCCCKSYVTTNCHDTICHCLNPVTMHSFAHRCVG